MQCFPNSIYVKDDSKTQERTQVINHVRQWGGPMAITALDPSTLLFNENVEDGLIAYRATHGYAVVLGDPICDLDKEKALILAFHKYCDLQQLKTIYIATSEAFAKRLGTYSNCQAIQCCEYAFFDPRQDPRDRTGVYASLVRRKVRHAQKEGITVLEYTQQSPLVEQSMEQVAKDWLRARKGLQIYTNHVRLFEDRLGKRWFYAKQGEKVVGVVTLNKMESKQGWHLNHLMFVPEAPHGTPEILVVHTMNTLAKENCQLMTAGLIVGKNLGEISGLNSITAWIIRQTFTLITTLFNLDRRKKFWEKFHLLTTPAYVVFRESSMKPKGILAIIKALNAL